MTIEELEKRGKEIETAVHELKWQKQYEQQIEKALGSREAIRLKVFDEYNNQAIVAVRGEAARALLVISLLEVKNQIIRICKEFGIEDKK